MTPRLLTRQVQEEDFTRYDFLPGQSRLRPFRGRSEELLSQVIVLGYFPDTLDNLGREGRLVGEALELWLKERKKREDHEQAQEDEARL